MEGGQQLASKPELRKNDLAFFHCEWAGAIPIVTEGKFPSFFCGQQIFGNYNYLLSYRGGGFGVG